MVITQLEARLTDEQAKKLQAGHGQTAGSFPPGFRQSFLVHSTADSAVWRILTLWESREAIEAMRSQGTPKGVLLFRQAGVEPTLTIFDVDHAISA